MKRKVTAMEARKRLGELLEGVYYRGDEVVIERAGKPMAVVIPSARYEAMNRERERERESLWAMIEEVHERNKDVPYEVIQQEVDEAIREVRQEARRRTTPRRKAV
jgi:prevent-host-death family protein